MHSIYTASMDAATVDKILSAIESGSSQQAAAVANGIPESTWRLYRDTHPDIAARYARAISTRADVLAEGALAICDEPPPRIGEYSAIDGAWVQNQRLRIDTRKWFASKLHPGKYGDKQAVEHTGGVTLNISVKGDAPDV